MRKSIPFALLITGVFSVESQAANFAVIASPPIFMNAFVFLLAFVSIFGCFKVYDLVRGGSLSKTWKIFMAGFVSLALSQAGYLSGAFELAVLPSYIVPALLVVAASFFVYGVFETLRVLK